MEEWNSSRAEKLKEQAKQVGRAMSKLSGNGSGKFRIIEWSGENRTVEAITEGNQVTITYEDENGTLGESRRITLEHFRTLLPRVIE